MRRDAVQQSNVARVPSPKVARRLAECGPDEESVRAVPPQEAARSTCCLACFAAASVRGNVLIWRQSTVMLMNIR